MKKAAFILVSALFLVGATACKKTKEEVDKLTEFDINYSTNLTIPATTYTASVPVDFTTPEVSTQSSTKFSSEKTAADLVSEVKMTKFDISSGSGNLDFLKSITVYIKTTGLGDVQVATKSNP